MPPTALVLIWAAYRQGRLDWVGLRVWFALWEIKQWHAQRVRQGKPYRYDTSKVLKALHTTRLSHRQVEAAIATLQTLGLVRFDQTTIVFEKDIHNIFDPELHRQATEMLKGLHEHNTHKNICFPRRILNFICRSPRQRSTLVGTVLALLFRCMLVKAYDCYKGCCKAAWIKQVFGGNLAGIRAARSRLIRLGWFEALPTHPSVQKVHGPWYRLALEIRAVPPTKTDKLTAVLASEQPRDHGVPEPNKQVEQEALPTDLVVPDQNQKIYADAINKGIMSQDFAHMLLDVPHDEKLEAPEPKTQDLTAVHSTPLDVDTQSPDATKTQHQTAKKATETQHRINQYSFSQEEKFKNQFSSASRESKNKRPGFFKVKFFSKARIAKWVNIEPSDLVTPERREQLYLEALEKGIVKSGYAHRLTFFCAITHVLRCSTSNIGGMLRSILENPLYQTYITQADEDKALQWLKNNNDQPFTPWRGAEPAEAEKY